MRAFAALFAELDGSTSTLAKVDALKRYFGAAAERGAYADAAWAVYFLAGGKPRQTVPSRVLRDAARSASGMPEWLFEESYQAVGDLAETIAHLLPPAASHDDAGLATWIEQRLLPLKGLPPEVLEQRLLGYWATLDFEERFLLVKLIGGSFRVGVSKLLVVRALAELSGIDAKRIAQRIIGYTDDTRMPTVERYRALIAEDDGQADAGHPYPFFLAHPLQGSVADLGVVDQWLVEWKWDGIRAQVVRRDQNGMPGIWIWSRGEELVTDRFPELAVLECLPAGTVLDGEIVVWDAGRAAPMPFAALQTRIGRKLLSKKVLAAAPVGFLAYDLLEVDGEDWRERPQHERRARLESIVAQSHGTLQLSPLIHSDSWTGLEVLRQESRARGVEGFMLKRRDAPYGVGRARSSDGPWLKWKIDPMSVDAVLVYAQPGHGRRASLYTDYTFAVWQDEAADEGGVARTLVPFAKAYSGLTDAEIRSIDAIIRKTTVEKFGPVRSVTPTLVMEIGFEGIQRSSRHKSGIAVRFPRILRIREDKPVEEADTMQALEGLLDLSSAPDSSVT